VRALARLVNSRFQSFSEATDSVLGALAGAVPGTIVLGQIDDEGRCRVIDLRGTRVSGLDRGTPLPLAGAPPAGSNGGGAPRPPDGQPDQGFLGSLGLPASLAAPLELSGGRIAGTLLAVTGDPGAYRAEHAALLGVGARLLGYEWESVQSRAELRRLRAAVADGSSTDADTALPNREHFLDLVEREWRLVDRGLVAAVLVTCKVGPVAAGDTELAAAAHRLAIKDAAEVMSATARATDQVGRTGGDSITSVLVGCNPEGALRFIQRFRAALERVTRTRPLPLEVTCSLQPLEGTGSAAEALELVETDPAFSEDSLPGIDRVVQEA
jgi:GGDEF domain-containing protein